MKKVVLVLGLFVAIIGASFADENQQDKNTNLYTFFFNIVGEQFHFPLIGFVNIANGDHNLPQIGFINWNQGNFKTLQMGFVNTAGGDMTGFQMGFINTIGGDMTGFQTGFVNTTVGNMNGVQLGFINYADSVGKGVPIGFLSIVRHGGYKAIEFGVSETSPFNLSFKIGIERFYTSFSVGYNPFREDIQEQFIDGIGFGTIIQMGKVFFFNPEIIYQSSINRDSQNFVSLVPYFGYKFMSNMSVVAGPSILWTYFDNNEMQEPFINILKYDINEKHKLYFGGRIALRIDW